MQQLVLILQITGIDKEVYIKVKHCLYKSKKFQQGKIKHEERRKKNIILIIEKNSTKKGSIPTKYYLLILQTRSFPTWQRLLSLSLKF